MNCEQIEQTSMMRRFLDGALDDEVKREFQGHVSTCEACQGELRLAATLMLQEPLHEGRVFVEATQPSTSVWASLREWLFPSGVRMWQPALAFAAVLVVAVPMLKTVWFPADTDMATTYRTGQTGSTTPQLESQLKGALGALSQGEAKEAFTLLDPHSVNWDRGRMENVFIAYRVRARAAAELGWDEAALQDLNRAMSFAELDPDRLSCIQQDVAAVKGEGAWCPLPSADDIH